jgi:hypothetical protein
MFFYSRKNNLQIIIRLGSTCNITALSNKSSESLNILLIIIITIKNQQQKPKQN